MATDRSVFDVLIIGGESIIGSALLNSYLKDDLKVWSTTRKAEKINEQCFFLNFENEFIGNSLPDVYFKTVFICVGVTSIKQCTDEPVRSSLVNIKNTVAVAEYFINKGSFVVYLSTGAVFDGELAFSETDETVNPRTEYGKQKAKAEKLLFSFTSKMLAIIRLSKVIQPDMPLIQNWIRDIKSGISISPFSDMVIAPVALDLVVSFLKKIATQQIPGIHHLSANKDISYFNVALYIAGILGIDQKMILPGSYNNAGILWIPQNTTLNCSRLGEIGMFSPSPLNAFHQLMQLQLSN